MLDPALKQPASRRADPPAPVTTVSPATGSATTGLGTTGLGTTGLATSSLVATRPAWLAATLVATLGAALLGGCSSGELSRSFGFVRDTPDEYTVTTQMPLSMPPQYSLRPPLPGAGRPQDQSTRQQAEEALVPQTALNGTPAGQPSSGQAALVAAAGPAAPSNIRSEVNNEAVAAAEQSHSFVDTLMFWRTPQPPGIVVDPQKEAQRIRENAALGRNQEAGDTPIIQPRRKGWLEGLF